MVTKDLTITGAGSLFGTNVTTSGAGSVFAIAAGRTVSLSKMMIFGGKASQGGGIRNFGQLTVTSVVLANNSASSGGGIYNEGALTLSLVTVVANTAGMGGGLTCVGLSGGLVLIADSRIIANQATGSVQDVGRIGGIAHSGFGLLLIVRSAVAWNTDLGIASATSDGALFLQDTTISSNSGTGLLRRGGQATLTNATIAQNESYGLDVRFATVSVRNSIVANNDPFGWSSFGPQCASDEGIVQTDHSLFGDWSCNAIPLDWANSLFAVDPGLTPLGYHGGFTPIHQLLPGNPAIDAGGNALCWPTDQHGTPRPIDGDGDGVAHCDMGAFEAKGTGPRAPERGTR
jgi:predicted outer membrane repeat protein